MLFFWQLNPGHKLVPFTQRLLCKLAQLLMYHITNNSKVMIFYSVSSPKCVGANLNRILKMFSTQQLMREKRCHPLLPALQLHQLTLRQRSHYRPLLLLSLVHTTVQSSSNQTVSSNNSKSLTHSYLDCYFLCIIHFLVVFFSLQKSIIENSDNYNVKSLVKMDRK